MVDKSKSGKSDKPKTTDEQVKSEKTPDVGGLTASLEALKSIADDGENSSKGDVVHLSSRSKKDKKASKRSADEPSNNDDTHRAQDKAAVSEPAEPLGVVELLGALKSDIDSLRQDNEEFKERLMSSPLTRGNSRKESGDDSSELRGLLEALQDDIGNLREENDLLRSQAIAAQDNSPAVQSEDEELYGMLVELKDDIVSLRTESDALRAGDVAATPARSAEKSDEVTMVLRELKSDIDDLKHDNEALRLENLTARDGAHLDQLGGQHDPYRNAQGGLGAGLLKGAGALGLAALAAGGGYYLAKTQGEHQIALERPMPTPALNRQVAAKQQPAKLPPESNPATPRIKPANPDAKPKAIKAPPAAITPPKSSVSGDVETAMMARASGLMEARDIGAARMVFVYLARHGSAVAMTRLAQTYDPKFLGSQGFDEDKNSDLERAKRLYGAASGMGDQEAAARLQEMQ